MFSYYLITDSFDFDISSIFVKIEIIVKNPFEKQL